MTTLTRRGFLAASAAALAAPALATNARFDLDYLEGLGEPGALHESVAYVPPSRVHEAYSHAFYVNTAFYGEGRQKMWVLQRQGAGWQVGLSDERVWGAAEADYSWPVSTGALHQGNPRAGPTPTGIYNVDERTYRHRTGWGSPGMYKAVYIDLHYTSGRQSGVAMHGTDSWRYNRLGSPASHGCVRMRQDNMDRTWAILHPGGAVREASPLWGEVPRYFASEPEDSPAARTGYVRDGSLLRGEDGAVLTRMGYTALFVFFRDDF
ncbi:L,D-transpeptidase [Wenxinia marina]|uniref:L,D-TPase catalytic domain-containing protein n=1 Tax=Wenxinia marina DSM 24838 TaxID=1123501 RepID=A0A0D0QD91_9RHOB|nr:L,D-transpeptidase [Wenxinia marina]KIQ68973.1 hypothetical protein Wenmar_02706 [Wenxinia marina DSM 24838]GGL63646.1 hypothetical protein GCM10011392_17980 [Wenxinia marina]